MKLGKIIIALFLCLSLSACKKEEKNIPMEEIDYRMEKEGYEVQKTLNTEGKVIGMNIKKEKFTIMFTEDKNVLKEIIVLDGTGKQYTINNETDTGISTIATKDKICKFDDEGTPDKANKKNCTDKDKTEALSLKKEFTSFLKTLDIKLSDLKAYYQWNTSE